MPLLHLAIAQFRPRKADVPGNLTRIGEVLAQAAAEADALASSMATT